MSAHMKLIADLNAQGFPINEVSDLYNEKYNYKTAVPLLVGSLDCADDPALLEEIVRALSVSWAKPGASVPLAKLFPNVEDKSGLGLRWVVANALAVVADDGVYDDVVRYLQDRSYGRSREMLALALVGMRNPGADDVLVSLLDDEEVVGHALLAIKKRKVKSAYGEVQRLVNHPKAWVRKEAKKTLKVLEKQVGHKQGLEQKPGSN